MNSQNASIGATGRDPQVLFQALLYGIARIQSLPKEKQEWSTMADMCTLLRAMADARPGFGYLVWGVESHVGHEIDLWPDSAAMTERDHLNKEALREAIKDLRDKFDASGLAIDAPPSDVVMIFE